MKSISVVNAAATIVYEGEKILVAKYLDADVPMWSMIGAKTSKLQIPVDCATRHLRAALRLPIHRSSLSTLHECTWHDGKGTPKETIVKTMIFSTNVPLGTAEANLGRARNLGLLLKAVPPRELPALTPFKKRHRSCFEDLGIWPKLELVRTAA